MRLYMEAYRKDGVVEFVEYGEGTDTAELLKGLRRWKSQRERIEQRRIPYKFACGKLSRLFRKSGLSKMMKGKAMWSWSKWTI